MKLLTMTREQAHVIKEIIEVAGGFLLIPKEFRHMTFLFDGTHLIINEKNREYQMSFEMIEMSLRNQGISTDVLISKSGTTLEYFREPI